MNPYLKNLCKIEFVVTDACTGKCKHCSEGEHPSCGERIDPAIAADAVKRISAQYGIKTVMAFGGEPLLYPDAVYAIMAAARDAGVDKRQVITNGYFARSREKIREVALRLSECGVNDLLLSADAFHQETIPLSVLRIFIGEALECGIPIRLSPAWLVSETDENPYNRKTKQILAELSALGARVGEGNVIFPEGNAKKHLAAYFEKDPPRNPYEEDPKDVRCVSFSANGDVLGRNIYKNDIIEILKAYYP